MFDRVVCAKAACYNAAYHGVVCDNNDSVVYDKAVVGNVVLFFVLHSRACTKESNLL